MATNEGRPGAQYVVNTRTTPARSGCDVTIIAAPENGERAMALCNHCVDDGVYWAQTDVSSLRARLIWPCCRWR